MFIDILVREGGADIDAADSEGNSPLILACKPWKIAPPLVSRSTRHTVRNYHGFRSEDWNEHRPIMIDMLTQLGANIAQLGSFGKQGIHFAAFYGMKDVIGKLLGNQANIEAEDQYGNTPIMEAVRGSDDFGISKRKRDLLNQVNCQGHPNTINFLLLMGASINHVNKHEETAGSLAFNSERQSCGRFDMQRMVYIPPDEDFELTALNIYDTFMSNRYQNG